MFTAKLLGLRAKEKCARIFTVEFASLRLFAKAGGATAFSGGSH